MLFFHHLANLPVDSLAGEFFQLQQEEEIEGLVSDCKEHVVKMGNLVPKDTSKRIWKSKTILYIKEKNRNDLLNNIKGYKKLNYAELNEETFERKNYFFEQNLEDVRVMFKIKSEVLPTIRKNFKRKYKNNSLSCPSCQQLNLNVSSPPEYSLQHLLYECPTFEELRLKKNFNNDNDLLQFFKSVIKIESEKVYGGETLRGKSPTVTGFDRDTHLSPLLIHGRN